MRHCLAIVAVLISINLSMATGLHAQENCKPVRFAAGASSAEVNGDAPPEDVLCFSLETGNGQTATVRVTRGNNIVFSILGVVDAQDSFIFTTEAKTYEIIVGQLMRSVTDQPFTLQISVTDP
ncbi:MAG: hypothetical protein AAGC96_01185 [Pseudomonadota bacterium]